MVLDLLFLLEGTARYGVSVAVTHSVRYVNGSAAVRAWGGGAHSATRSTDLGGNASSNDPAEVLATLCSSLD